MVDFFMSIETYESVLNEDADLSLTVFKKLKNENVYQFLNTIFDLYKKDMSVTSHENLQYVLKAIAPTFPEDHLEKFYENGSATDAFPVFEMFVDAGYHASWQWGSEDFLVACCVSGSAKYLPKMFVRQSVTQKDLPLLIFSSFNPNSEVFETLLSRLDLQETYDNLNDLCNNKGAIVAVEWKNFREHVNVAHIQTLQDDLFNRLCAAQRETISSELSSVQPTVARKKM